MHGLRKANIWLAFYLIVGANSIQAAELTRTQVEQLLAKADKQHPADLRRKDLTDLDLSNLDFRNADLWGADLRRSNLNNSNLQGLTLDLTVMTRIKLSGANLAIPAFSGSV